jgi:uncharacterized membrane protein
MSSIFELEIGLERTLANRTSRINRRQEANLIISFSRVPFSQAFNMNIFGITTTFARCNQGVCLSVLLVEAHVTNWAIPKFDRCSVGALNIL